MKVENRERLVEIKGTLYGLTYCNTEAFADVLVDVIDEIGDILEDEKKGEIVLGKAEFNTLLRYAGNVQNSAAVHQHIERVYHPEGVENS